MTEIEFFPYHNRHIMFKLRNGQELSGVIFDSISSRLPNEPRTFYSFIPTKNMIAWKKAEQENNKDMMKKLEQKIDIQQIEWAERLNY